MTGTGLPSSGDLSFRFNKSNGSVKEVGGVVDAGGGVYKDATSFSNATDVYAIKVTSNKNASKFKTVFLIATTGRHYTDK